MIDINKLKDKEFINNIRKADSVIIDGEVIKTYKNKVLKIEKLDERIEMELLSSYHRMLPAGK